MNINRKTTGKKRLTESDWWGVCIGFIPAAIIVGFRMRVGAIFVVIIALGGYYAVKLIAQKAFGKE